MDPVSAIEARIGAIEARFGALAPAPSGAGPGGDFASVLAAATAQVSGSPTLDRSPASSAVGPAPGSSSPVGLPSLWAQPAPGQAEGVGSTPANRVAAGQYPRLTPPAELVAYGNGRIPPAALEAIDTSGAHRLWAPAARAFRAMAADASAAGVTLRVTDSYRPLEAQERLARQKGLYRDGGLAAVPGTSNHGWGLALDLNLDSSALAWMRDNGWRHGFVEDVPREPWHWTYRPAGSGS
jgi:zinc D-Ala-D-Ala carboxypeptidase